MFDKFGAFVHSVYILGKIVLSHRTVYNTELYTLLFVVGFISVYLFVRNLKETRTRIIRQVN